jgi:hypothetical protein
MIGLLLALLLGAAGAAETAAPGAAPADPKTPTPGIAVASPAPAPPAAAPAPAAAWRSLEAGLDLGEFAAPRPGGDGALVHVLRIDPARWRLRLLNATAESDGLARTARGWAGKYGLAAVINASMYQADLRSSVSLMRTAGHVNNPRLSKDKAVLAFDRTDPAVPVVQIIDRECQDFDALSHGYATLVQSIRMVSCAGRNVWSPQPQAWSTSAIGMDRQGRVLFIHMRTPYPTHDLVEALLALPIDLKNAMYTEGGHEAQLYVTGGGREYEFVGGGADGDIDGEPAIAWPIPNVIGVAPNPGTSR